MRGDQYHRVAGRQCGYRRQYYRMPLVVLDFAYVKTAVDIQQRRIGVLGRRVPVAPCGQPFGHSDRGVVPIAIAHHGHRATRLRDALR